MKNSKEPVAPTASEQTSSSADASTMPFVIRAQYLKDLSFESPTPLKSLSVAEEAPAINVGIEVGAQAVSEKNFEVTLHITAQATRANDPLFVVEVKYSGLFAIGEVEEEHIQPLLLIEAPRYLFPFARNILSDATRDGGFPPLSLAPVDFSAMYRSQQVSQESQIKAKEAKN